MGWLTKRLTHNYNKVPLLWVNFDLNKYQQSGAKNSCMAHVHPVLANDEHIKNTVYELIDYIRDNYDMEKLSK